MRMKIVILFVLSIGLLSSNVFGETFSDEFPGGKNYLNPENMVVVDNELSLLDSIKVKPNQEYTLTLPNPDLLGDNVYITVFGNYEYIDEALINRVNCEIDDLVICHFITESDETYLNLAISSTMMNMYFDYYQTENFQLEEGSLSTEFEEYVIPYMDTTNPVFNGSGGFIKSYQSNSTITEIIAEHIIAIDEVDGNITNRIIIEEDYYTGNENIVGEYNVTLSVSDLSGNEAYFNLSIIVKDEVLPVINIASLIYANVDHNLVLSTILDTELEYYDEYDPLPQLEILEDNYSIHRSEIGSYNVSLQVTDSSGNVVIKDVSINVFDDVAPVVNSSLQFKENVNSPREINEIISELIIEDNYDSNPQVMISNDAYTLYKDVVGIHFVTITVIDSSLNERNYTLEIHVEDEDAPIITGFETISFSYADLKDVAELINMLIIEDNYSSLTSEDIYIIEDTYSNKTSHTGNFYVLLGLKDESNNETQKRIDIIVYDDVLPIIFVDDYIVIIETGTTFTSEDAYKLLLLNKELRVGTYQIDIIEDEYTGNEKSEGTYLYKVMFTNEVGEEYIKDFLIEVNPKEHDNQYLRYYIEGGLIILFSGFIIYKKRK